MQTFRFFLISARTSTHKRNPLSPVQRYSLYSFLFNFLASLLIGQLVHRTTGAMLDEVIADTLKDEMIDGMGNNPSVLVTSVNYDSGNHSAHNSDDGDAESKSPIHLANSINHHDDYDSSTLQSFTHLTNATDASHVLNRDIIYSTVPSGSAAIIHQMPVYENVLHPAPPR